MAGDGPPASLGEEIAQQWDVLYATAIHWASGKAEVAEDLVQSAMLRALRYQAKFTPGTNLKAWLITIMKHIWFDDLRRQRRVGQAVSLDAITEHGQADGVMPATTIDDEVMARVGLDEALREIDKMPSCYMDVMRAVALEDKPYQQVASELGIPLGSAHSATFRARRRLRASLGVEHEHEAAAPASSRDSMKVRRRPEPAADPPLSVVEPEPTQVTLPQVVERAERIAAWVPLEDKRWREVSENESAAVYGWTLIAKLALMRAWVRMPRRRRLVELADDDLLNELRPLTARIGVVSLITRIEPAADYPGALKLAIRLLNARGEPDDPIECEWLAVGVDAGGQGFGEALERAHVNFWRHTLLLLERRRAVQMALPEMAT